MKDKKIDIEQVLLYSSDFYTKHCGTPANHSKETHALECFASRQSLSVNEFSDDELGDEDVIYEAQLANVYSKAVSRDSKKLSAELNKKLGEYKLPKENKSLR